MHVTIQMSPATLACIQNTTAFPSVDTKRKALTLLKIKRRIIMRKFKVMNGLENSVHKLRHCLLVDESLEVHYGVIISDWGQRPSCRCVVVRAPITDAALSKGTSHGMAERKSWGLVDIGRRSSNAIACLGGGALRSRVHRVFCVCISGVAGFVERMRGDSKRTATF